MTSAGSPSDALWPITDDSIRQAMEQMLADGSWGRYHGPHCDTLRRALGEYHVSEHVHLCSSGTSAVELALRAVNVAPGDEVILAAYDYKANFANVVALGARPILVDTLAGRPVMDPQQLPAALSSATKAILCSHLHGCLAPLEEINQIAASHGLPVIEDACQVPGAVSADRKAGTMGDVGVLSFGGSKLLTCGRGGVILTSDARIAQRITLYTQRGNDAYPLSEMQAAVVLPQLQQLDQRNRQRREAVRQLHEGLSDCGSLQLVDNDQTDGETAYYKVAFLNRHASITTRESLEQYCDRQPLDPGFPALHLIHAKSRFRAVGDLPHATELHTQLMTLHHPILLTDEKTLMQLTEQLIESSK